MTREDELNELIGRSRRGDLAAFAEIAERMAPRIHALAKLILGDDDLAADAAQETLIRVWQELPRLREPERFEAWLHRITVNKCRDELRHKRRIQTLVREVVPQLLPDASQYVADRAEIGAAFRRLRHEQREVLALRYYSGLEPAEIAAVLGARPGTVRSRLHHALRALRAELEAERRAAGPRATPLTG